MHLIRTLISVAALLATTGLALADFPERALTLVVPFPAGSPVDQAGRLAAQLIEGELGQPVIVENRTGAGGTTGTEFVVRSRPDGYTVLITTSSSVVVAPAIYPSLPFDPVAGLKPMVALDTTGLAIQVNSGVPADTARELIDYARANPGALSFGSAGIGTTPHLAGEMFMDATGVEMIHIPYQGSPAATVDLLAGNIDVMFTPTSTAAANADSDSVKTLAVLANRRAPGLDDVPTAEEAGTPEIAQSPGWFGFFVPAGTPDDAAAKLQAALEKVLVSDEVRSQLGRIGLLPDLIVGGDFERRVASDLEVYKGLADRAEIKVQ